MHFAPPLLGGVEALAGLMPVQLHLKKLAKRANFRVATLTDTHPTRSLLQGPQVKGAALHRQAMGALPERIPNQVPGTIREIHLNLPLLTEVFSPTDDEAQPGNRLLDCFADQVHFNSTVKDPKKSVKENLEIRVDQLNRILAEVRGDPTTVYAATDASVPKIVQFQAVSAAIIYREHERVHETRHVAGKVTSRCGAVCYQDGYSTYD